MLTSDSRHLVLSKHHISEDCGNIDMWVLLDEVSECFLGKVRTSPEKVYFLIKLV